MEPNLQKLFTQLKSERLSASERARIKRALTDRMAGSVETYAPWRFVSLIRVRQLVYVAFAVVFLFGGVSFAAEQARPGDTLYALKIQVNEPVRKLLAFSPGQKLAVAATIVERRVSESRLENNQAVPAGEVSTVDRADESVQAFLAELERQEDRVEPAQIAEVTSRVEALLRAKSADEKTAAPTVTAATPSLFSVDSSDRRLPMQAATVADNTLVQLAAPRLKTAADSVEMHWQRYEAKLGERGSTTVKTVTEIRIQRAQEALDGVERKLEKKALTIPEQTRLSTKGELFEAREKLKNSERLIKLGDLEAATNDLRGVEHAAQEAAVRVGEEE